MTRERLDLGKLGEDLAFKRIKRLGYRKIIRNYRCPLGEVDLIAQDGDTLAFIEIKTRRAGTTGYAKEAVDEKKKRQLSKVALYYLKDNQSSDAKARFDVVAVSLDGNEQRIEVVKDAFELAY